MGLHMGDNVTFSINGVKMGTLQAADLTTEYIPEREFKNGDNLRLFNREYTVTMEDVQFSKEFFNTILPTNKRYKVVGTGYKYPRGNKLPKKKRIRNKWIKKYQHEFVLDDCLIV